MLKPEFFLPPLLLALSGCYTAPKPHAPNWNELPDVAMETEHVSEGKEIAAPKNISPVFAPVHTNQSFIGTWISLEHWNEENQIGSLEQITPPPNRSFALTTSNGVLVIPAHSLVAKWKGVEFHIGFEPQMVDDHLFINALDLRKNIQPLLQPFCVTAKTNRVVVIDPGHGGLNAGTRSLADGSNEKEFTLALALRLEPLLATNGWQVFLTRTDDQDMSLSNRVTFANEHKADLFISLHFNAIENNSERTGLETICLTPAGMRSTFTRGYEDNTSLVFTNNAYDMENFEYAMLLHRAVLKACDLNDRGVRRARFLGVLRGQNHPAVLIEGGYLSNSTEAKRIADPQFQEQMAEAIADALK